jgi:hypothetical protein
MAGSCVDWLMYFGRGSKQSAASRVMLHISSHQAPVFLELVQKHGRGLWVKTLILDFPLVHEQMTRDAILTFSRHVIDACPTSPVYIWTMFPRRSPQLISRITSPLITSFAMRSIGPYSASPADGFIPEASAEIPHMSGLRRLALWGCNIASIAVTSQHATFRGLCDIHLCVTLATVSSVYSRRCPFSASSLTRTSSTFQHYVPSFNLPRWRHLSIIY